MPYQKDKRKAYMLAYRKRPDVIAREKVKAELRRRDTAARRKALGYKPIGKPKNDPA